MVRKTRDTIDQIRSMRSRGKHMTDMTKWHKRTRNMKTPAIIQKYLPQVSMTIRMNRIIRLMKRRRIYQQIQEKLQQLDDISA